MTPTSDNHTVINLETLVSELGAILDNTILHVAKRCAVDGVLVSHLLDAHQVISYDIAWASAELLAAEKSLRSCDTSRALDNQLCDVYATGAIVNTLARLERIFIDLDLSLEALDKIARSPALIRARTKVNVEALSEIGALVTEATDLAHVSLGPDLEMIQEAFQRFAASEVVPHAHAIHRDDLGIPHSIIDGMREMGAFGLSIPEAFGGNANGSGDDLPTMVAVTETLSEASLGAAGSLITRPEILSRALLAGGTQAQKTYWLPRIASGESLCAIAITEPDYGSDVAQVSLKAVRTEGGWLLNGAKTWCTFAGKANLLMVVARSNPDASLGYRGLSLFLVEKPSFDGHDFVFTQTTGGRLEGRAIRTIGYRGMHSFDLHFDNVLVSDDHLIGAAQGLGKGFYYTMAGMVGGRLQTAARASGVMRAALNAAVAHITSRRVFGQALADYQLTKTKLALMASTYAACRKLTYWVSANLEGDALPMHASMVKLLACRAAETITREALQLHGGMGYAEETAVSRYFVDARVLSIFEGAEETLALKVISKDLFEIALRRQKTAPLPENETHHVSHQDA